MRWLVAFCVLARANASTASSALARVDAVVAWLDGEAEAPAHWRVRSRRDLPPRWHRLGGGKGDDIHAEMMGTARTHEFLARRSFFCCINNL